MKRTLLTLAVLFLGVLGGSAQNGLPPFGSFEVGAFDVVNRANLNTNFQIPIASTSGRGFGLTLSLVNDSIIYRLNSSQNAWSPIADQNGNATWGWKISSPFGSISRLYYTVGCQKVWNTYVYTDGAGTQHPFSVSRNDSTACGSGITGSSTGYATDNSGYYIDITSPDNPTAFSRDGIRMTGLGDVNKVTDPNGNFATRTVNGNTTVWSDTLNRSLVTVIDNRSGSSPNVIYQFLSETGSPLTIQVNYESVNVQTNFACTQVSEYAASNVLLPASVVYLPGDAHSRTYVFSYEPTPGYLGKTTGRIQSVQVPTGGTYTYVYPTSGNLGVNCADGSYTSLMRADGHEGNWTFSRNVGTSQTTVTPPGVGPSYNEYQLYTFNTSARAAHVVYYKDSATPLKTVDTTFDPNGTPSHTTTTLNDTNQQSGTDHAYDSNGVLLFTVEYDFGSGQLGSIIRKTTYTYLNSAPYEASNIIDRVTQKIVTDNVGSILERTDIGYDCYASPCAPLGSPGSTGVTHHDDANFGTSNTVRGNPTNITIYANAYNGTGALTTTLTYNILGNVMSASDPAGNKTTLSYSDSWKTSNCAPPGGAQAYLTAVTNAKGQTSSSQYNSCTGTLAVATDVNAQSTSYTYDSYHRQTTTSLPNGGGTTTTYNDSPYSSGVSPSVETDTKTSSAASVIDTTYFDWFGRPVQTTHGDSAGTDSSEIYYELNGLVNSTTNAHRSTTSDTDGTTTYTYDALGRPITITEADGSSIQRGYSGNQLTITDENANQKTIVTNAVGNVMKVVEDPSRLKLETDYDYDGLGNFVFANEKGGPSETQTTRTRNFNRDSLGRVTLVQTPEQGSISFKYVTSTGGLCSGDPANVCQRTDARNVVTTYAYDSLNRLAQKSYSDSTPTVHFAYDSSAGWGSPSIAQTNLVGRLSEVWTTSGSSMLAGAIFGYDVAGNLAQQSQCTPSNCGTSNYLATAQYDLAGRLTSLQYPSGRVVAYGYNSAGWMNSVQFTQYGGTTPVGGPYTFWSARDGDFYPSGAAKVATLGNGITQTQVGNSRVQPKEISITSALGTFADHTLNYQPSGQTSPANNGKVYSIADQLNSSLTQTFAYDHVNRLAAAAETGNRWGLSFGYDSWGNFLQQTVTAGTAFVRSDVADIYNHLTSRGYDANGNTVTDGSHQYVFDAENHITSVDSGASTYAYDGVGERARKTTGAANTDYLYFAGRLLAARNQNGTWEDYVAGPGGQIARAQDFDAGLHIYGTRCSNCGSQYMDYYFGNAGGLNNYVVRAGDKLYFTQYQPVGSRGGLIVFFSDGTNSNWNVKDKEGYWLNDDQSQGATHFRTVDLSGFAGKTITKLAANQESDTAGGAFYIVYEQIVLASADGSLRPIYTGQTSSPITSTSGTSGVTGAGSQIDINRNKAIYPQPTTTYFHSDHVGSSELLTGGYGYPIWEATYLPYGQEYNPQAEVDNFKFAGMVQDDESGLGHTWFRQYSGSMGRWMSPDPYSGSMDLTTPQTLNRYAYVLNDPVNLFDPLGLCPDGVDFCVDVWAPFLGDGMGGGGVGGHAPLLDGSGDGRGGGGGGRTNPAGCKPNPPAKPPANRYWTSLHDPNNPAWARLKMLGSGLGNFGMAGAKIGGAAGLELGSGGVGTPLAVIGVWSASGNLTAGLLQVVGSVMPDPSGFNEGAQVASAATSFSGLATLATGGSIEQAANNAQWEGILTSGFKWGATGKAPDLAGAYSLGKNAASQIAGPDSGGCK